MSTEVAVQDTGPTAIIQQHSADLATVMPSFVKSEVWIRVAIGSLRRDPKLMQAAANDPGALMVALLEAARKGLEPGTPEFYLTVRKEKGTPKIKGIEGYVGIVERIYRAGAAQSVIVEVVRENDTFTYVPGRDERPLHVIDWFGNSRGTLVGAYAYAVMQGGATSKVVVLNEAKVMEAKAKSEARNSEYSPWNQGDGEAMWLKTAARRLEKWVPTSNEYRKDQIRAALEVQAEQRPTDAPEPAEGKVDFETAIDAEVVDDPNTQWDDK